jgi:enoyl-CoA hydratase
MAGCYSAPEALATRRASGEARRMSSPAVRFETDGAIAVVTIDRPAARNAVDGPTAAALAEAFRRFDGDASLAVAVLAGAGGTFCAGADLKGFAEGRANRVAADGDGPMGPTRMLLDKPVIAAIEGYAVAGGLELAIWCDLRVAARDAQLGVFCRRFGVPLIDGGTVRLPRLIGMGRALDLILTGRAVRADEAHAMGLVDRLVDPGRALDGAKALARQLAALPQRCMREDRRSAYEQWDLGVAEAMQNELAHGMASLASGEAADGAQRFRMGAGRHGTPEGGTGQR